MTVSARLIEGAVRTQAVYVAVELGVADALAGGPLPIETLAARTGAHTKSLNRFLRALAAEGLFAETEPGVWANTSDSEPLREDALGTSPISSAARGTPPSAMPCMPPGPERPPSPASTARTGGAGSRRTLTSRRGSTA
jgi:methyltransferase family protein